MNHVNILLFCLLLCHQESEGQERKCLDLLLDIRSWQQPNDVKWNFSKSTGGTGGLCYVGAEHTDVPAHTQFEIIRRQFEFCNPTLVFYEGPNRGIAATDTATIRLYGESGYTRWLALQKGIPIATLEPSFSDLYGYLLSKFAHGQVDLYMLTKEASRLYYRKGMDSARIKNAINDVLAQVSNMTGTHKPMLTTLAQLDSAFHKHFNLDQAWWQVPQTFFDPSAKAGMAHFTNELAALSSAYRDIHMVQLLAKEVNAGKKVFAVVGKNHVPLQAAALDCAISNPNNRVN